MFKLGVEFFGFGGLILLLLPSNGITKSNITKSSITIFSITKCNITIFGNSILNKQTSKQMDGWVVLLFLVIVV